MRRRGDTVNVGQHLQPHSTENAPTPAGQPGNGGTFEPPGKLPDDLETLTTQPTAFKSTTPTDPPIPLAKNNGGASSSVKSTDFTSMQPDVPRGPKYVPAPLPWPEMGLYFAVWVGHALYALYLVWHVSAANRADIWGGHFEPGWPMLGGIRQDTSNYEWTIWKGQVVLFLPWFFAHALIFGGITRWLELWDNVYWTALQGVFAMGAHLWIFGLVPTFLGLSCGMVVLGVSALTKSKAAVWATAVTLLYVVARFFQEIFVNYADPTSIYEYEVVTAYKLLQFISAGFFYLEHLKKNDSVVKKGGVQDFFRFYLSMMHYAFYLPYTVALIVSYEDFQKQYAARRTQDYSITHLLCLISRVVLYCFAFEVTTHFLYYNALFEETGLLYLLTIPELCAVAYVAGQFFHVKYFAIFGVPSIFAKLDGLTPPFGPPICISRVALYSKMWRYFDRGLYAFIRDMIFLPVAAPGFAYWRRLLATLLSFGFVWVWHSPNYYYAIWIGMNFAEINLENVGKELVWNRPAIRAWVQTWVSPRNQRRIFAVMQIPCVAIGILSIFYFLGGHAGWIVVKRVLLDQVLRLTPGGFWLLGLGYCYCNVCIELQSRIGY